MTRRVGKWRVVSEGCICCLLMMGAASLACVSAKPPEQGQGWRVVPLHPVTQAPAIVAYSRGQSGYFVSSDRYSLAIGLWADGTIIWDVACGADRAHSYRQAQVEPEVCETIRARIVGLMNRPDRTSNYNAIPDSRCDTVIANDGWSMCMMTSSVELLETVEKSCESIEDHAPSIQKPSGVGTSADDWREAWVLIRDALKNVVPKDGIPIDIVSIQYGSE